MHMRRILYTVQCNNVQSACATNCNEAQTGYKACSLVRNYFVIKDIAWDFEDKNHESCSILARGDKWEARSRGKEARLWPRSWVKEAKGGMTGSKMRGPGGKIVYNCMESWSRFHTRILTMILDKIIICCLF